MIGDGEKNKLCFGWCCFWLHLKNGFRAYKNTFYEFLLASLGGYRKFWKHEISTLTFQVHQALNFRTLFG